MADYYSNLFELAPFRGAQNFLGRNANVDHRGQVVGMELTYNIPTGTVLATNDVIHLVPIVPGGLKVRRLVHKGPGFDGGAALVVNLGWASVASGGGIKTAFGTGNLRSAATDSLADADMIAQTAANGAVTTTTNGQAAGSFDELRITVTTGAASAGTNGTATVYLEVEYI